MDGAKMPMPPPSPAPSSSQSEKRDASKRVTVIQIAACLLILLAAALLRYTSLSWPERIGWKKLRL